MKFSSKAVVQRIALAAGLVFLGNASAHQAWIEQNAKGATFYFGEFGENLREASPGLLDKFQMPVAHKISGKAKEIAVVSKTPRGFAISAHAAQGESLIAEETSYPSWEQKRGTTTQRGVYMPAARLVTDLKQQAPQLALDLVPTGVNSKSSVELQAFYKGQPLPKAKVVLVTAAGWSQEHHTDEAGKLKVATPWRGTYVLELAHSDKTAGQRGEEKYDFADYVTSLTLTQSTGLAALAAPAPAAPSKGE